MIGRVSAIVLLACCVSLPVAAQDIFLSATRQGSYNDANDNLAIAIANHEYTLIKVQPVDQGLREKGYESSNYKVFFFGDRKQVDEVLTASPEASVLLPLKIILYQRGDTAVATAPSMAMWKNRFGASLNPLIDQWERDVRAILRDFSQ